MADSIDALVQLADSIKQAKQVTADAAAKMDAAKIAQLRANASAEANAARADELNKQAMELAAKSKDLEVAQGNLTAGIMKLNADRAALAAREREIAANEERVQTALANASRAEQDGKSYEGMAYAKLEAARKKLAEFEAL